MPNDEKMRLFIKKIDIANCGRFFGKAHTIELSDSTEKNITIIIGLSGRGKSTIHDLIYWCFYGQFKNSGEENEKEDYGLVNVDTLENLQKGESVTASVSISLHDDKGEKYKLTRDLKATFNRESRKRKFEQLNNSRVPEGIDFETSVKLVVKKDGDVNIVDNSTVIRNEINKMFPQHLSDFFLFDGENLIKFKNQTQSSEFIKNGITKISGLGVVHYMIQNTRDVANNIKKSIAGKNANTAPLVHEVLNLETRITELDDEIQNKENERDKKHYYYDGVIRKLSKSEDRRGLLKKQQKTQKNLDAEKKENKKNSSEFKEFLFEKLPQVLINDTINNAEAIFARLEKEDKIPPSISSSAIDKILKSVPLKCVCGREFEKNDDQHGPWMTLTNMKNAIIADDLSQGISVGRDLLSRISDGIAKSKIEQQFHSFIDTRTRKRNQINELTIELDDYDRQLRESSLDDDIDLVDEKTKLRDKIAELDFDINSAKQERNEKNEELEKSKKRLDKEMQKEGDFGSELAKSNLGYAISKFSTELEKRIKEVLREKTERETSRYFLESAPEKDTFAGIKISNNYDITARDANDLTVKLSKGQAHVLGLSYVAGIREITNTKTFLIIDSPLHNISGRARNEISDVYSKYLPGVQIVLLVTDTEYLQGDPDGAEPVKNILQRNGNVWREYELEHITTPEGIKCTQVKEITSNV